MKNTTCSEVFLTTFKLFGADETLSQVFDISSQSKQGVKGEVKIYANLYRVTRPPSRL